MTDDNWYQGSGDADRSYREDTSYGADGGRTQPKPGMSTALKVLIGFLIAGGLVALICCGGVAFFGYRVAQMATEDPVEIRTIQQGIADLDIPDDLTPKAGVNAEMMGFGMHMAVFENGDSALMVMQMNVPAEMQAEDMRRQFQQQLDQQGQNRNIQVESSEEREVTIAGEKTTIEIVKGKDQAGKELRQVNAVFQGKGGAAFLIYICPEEEWDEARVIGIIESIDTGARGAGNNDAAGDGHDADAGDADADDADVGNQTDEAETNELPAE